MEPLGAIVSPFGTVERRTFVDMQPPVLVGIAIFSTYLRQCRPKAIVTQKEFLLGS